MRDITQLITAISQNNPAQTHTQLSTQNSVDNVMKQPTQQLQDAIEVTFTTWKRLFRTKMRDEDWMPDTAEIWAIALTDLRITGRELAVAQRKSMSLEWPPTAPADFLALARTVQASPYPTANDAFTTACQNCGMKGDIERNWKHAAVYETANRIGWGKLASATDYFFKTFKQVYEQVVSEHKAGKTFVVPKSHRLANVHQPVEVGSEADKRISEKLAELRKISA